MRIEIVIFLVAAAVMANIYTEGKLLKRALAWKKYYQMAGVALGALFLYWLMKKNPDSAQKIIMSSNEYVKYLPIDKNATSMLTPILDFTTKHTTFANNEFRHPLMPMEGGGGGGGGPGGKQAAATQRLMKSGKNATKRSVSETKKKFVAAKQGWKCENCKRQLPAWFEVDHKIRLEYGGSNHIDNLVALCRDCHGEKTAIENL